jgi:hypothetical protein
MTRKNKSPATLAGVNRGSEIVLANASENTRSLPTIQAHFVSRLFGLPPTRAALVAALAFPQNGGRE